MIEDHTKARSVNAFERWRPGFRTLGHAGVDAVNKVPERRIETIARVGKVDLDFSSHAPGIGCEYQNAVAHQYRFFDVVRYHQHRLDRQSAFDPQVNEVGTQRLRSQNIER